MRKIKKDSIRSFWWEVFMTSAKSVFTAEETKKKWFELLLSIGTSIAFATAGVVYLGNVGFWAKSTWTNMWTYLQVFMVFCTIRFISNLPFFSARHYFEQRKIADILTWGDVKSSVWKDPEEKPFYRVGITLEREESHQVNYMRATLKSVMRNGVPIFSGGNDCHLPIWKESGQYNTNWMSSFSDSKPRKILLAYIDDGKMRLDTAQVDKTGGQVKIENNVPLVYESGMYTIVVEFKSENSENNHVFKGDLVFDGQSLTLKKRKL